MPVDSAIKEEARQAQVRTLSVAGIFALIWAVLGLGAFVTSLICFGRSGTMGQQVAGLIIAILFGPFYWIYFTSVKTYCRPFPVLKGGARSKS